MSAKENFDKVNVLVEEYMKKNNVSPFHDIKEIGEGQIEIDMDTKFEKTLLEEFEDVNTVMSDYISELIKSIVNDPNFTEELKKAQDS